MISYNVEALIYLNLVMDRLDLDTDLWPVYRVTLPSSAYWEYVCYDGRISGRSQQCDGPAYRPEIQQHSLMTSLINDVIHSWRPSPLSCIIKNRQKWKGCKFLMKEFSKIFFDVNWLKRCILHVFADTWYGGKKKIIDPVEVRTRDLPIRTMLVRPVTCPKRFATDPRSITCGCYDSWLLWRNAQVARLQITRLRVRIPPMSNFLFFFKKIPSWR